MQLELASACWSMRILRSIVLPLIERQRGVMHCHVTRNTRYETIGKPADGILTFLRVEVPKYFGEFAQTITDHFRVIDPKDYRIVARRGYIYYSPPLGSANAPMTFSTRRAAQAAP